MTPSLVQCRYELQWVCRKFFLTSMENDEVKINDNAQNDRIDYAGFRV